MCSLGWHLSPSPTLRSFPNQGCEGNKTEKAYWGWVWWRGWLAVEHFNFELYKNPFLAFPSIFLSPLFFLDELKMCVGITSQPNVAFETVPMFTWFTEGWGFPMSPPCLESHSQGFQFDPTFISPQSSFVLLPSHVALSVWSFSKLNLSEGGSVSTAIFNRDIQLRSFLLFMFYIRLSLCT